MGIVDPTEATDPDNCRPNESATSLVSTDHMMDNIVNGLVVKDPSVVNDPAFAPYREIDSNGDPYINVPNNLTDQAAIRDHLYSHYEKDVESWYTNFLAGLHTGTIQVAGR